MYMKRTQPIIQNSYGEKLDTWVETPDAPVKANVVMVHGFGTNKHETAGYFNDVAQRLIAAGYRVIRFDFSGYGDSEGRQEDVCFSKHVGDLATILDFVRGEYQEDRYLLAQSMGTWITALCAPTDCKKCVFTGIPNADTRIMLNRFVARFQNRPGAILDVDGVSFLPRSTGEVQKIGPKFWSEIKAFNPVQTVKKFSEQTELLIIHWNQDDIIGLESLKEYDALPAVQALYLDGDHSVTKPENRNAFINILLEFYNK